MYRKMTMYLGMMLFFFLLFLQTNESSAAVAAIDMSKKYQTIEGFGGGFNFGVYPFGRANKDELYDSIFNRAGINIVRIGNHYDPSKDSAVDEILMMKEIQEKWPQVKVMLAAWSPPPYLKSNNSIYALLNKDDRDTGTIKKDSSGLFMYGEYADYWLKSVQKFQSGGVDISWISIQNEPNWAPVGDGCFMTGTETSRFPSYGKALDAVYNKFQTMTRPLPLIGPDITGIGAGNMQKYLTSDLKVNQLVALTHHFYNGVDSISMCNTSVQYPDNIFYQTEYLVNEAAGKTWFNHAQIIQMALVDEGVSMYNIFALAYRKASTHCFFSLDSIGSGFTVRQIYYAFKHFSKSIHRGWRRVEAAVDEAGLKISAFADSSGDSLAIVVINKKDSAASMSLTLPKPGMTGEIYQTSDAKKYVDEGAFSGSGPIDLAPKSITTIEAPKQTINTRPIRQTNRLIARPAILKVKPFGKNRLSVSFHAPVSLPYTIAIYDASGKKRSSSSNAGTDRFGISTHVFEGPFAGGFYIVRLQCDNAAQKQKAIVVP